ncbi:damage-control phosphatase ARMT1 family protein [Desulfurobacterium sp.]
MKVYPECIPCYMKQVYNILKFIDADRDLSIKVLRECSRFIAEDLNPDESPGHNATYIHRLFKKIVGVNDPFKPLKDKYTDIALRWEPEIEKTFYEPAEDKLDIAVRLAAVGNIIDFGIPRESEKKGNEAFEPSAFDLTEEVKNLLQQKFAYYDKEIFERFIVPGKTVLYVADNAGEIVFDKFLLRYLKEKGMKIIFAVRGGPILNDATIEDALKSGIDKIVDELITTGGDFIGIDFAYVGKEFKEAWEKAHVIISKGQANIETLEIIDDRDIFFILKAKCNAMAEELRCNKGELIFLYNKHLIEMKSEDSDV